MTDKERLQGMWQAVRAEVDGESRLVAEIQKTRGESRPAAGIEGTRFRFQGDKLTRYGAVDEDVVCTFELDTTATPRAILLTPESGPLQGKKLDTMIYELDCDTLKISIDQNGDRGKRPVDFRHSVIVLKRVTEEARPFLALWRQYGDGRLPSEAPYLRFAVWPDGRVLYSRDPDTWNHRLSEGKLSASKVARLKSALTASGVLTLKGTCYLVPDAPCDCLMVDLGAEAQQMLFWDERETLNYGININPKPHHLEFMRCWKAVNHMALLALPDEGRETSERLSIPKSWMLKQPVQSE